MAGGMVGAKLGTIVPILNVEMAKALDFQAPPEEWMRGVQKINATQATSDTLRLPIFTAPGLPVVKAPNEPAAREGVTNYYQDVVFDVLSKETDWTKELQQDLPDFDAHVRKRATSQGVMYRERLFQWRTSLMTGSAVDTGLPTLRTTAYDGQSVYSSSTRWRTTGGNSLTGNGVSSGIPIRKDFFRGVAQFAAFRHDRSGAKLWTRPEKETFLVEFRPGLWQEFVEAFHAEQVVQGGGATQSGSNVLLAFAKTAGCTIILMTNAYMAGDTWRISIISDSDRPNFVLAEKDPPKGIPLTEANAADMARSYAEGIVMHGRMGLAPAFTGGLMEMVN